MSHSTNKLEDLCIIKTGLPTGRAKKLEEGTEGREVKVLLPKAMANGKIIDSELSTEIVGDINQEYLTREGDVVIKLSTPYDCVYIDDAHEGILITSFGMVLRNQSVDKLDMRYLSALLNSSWVNASLQSKASGQSTVKLLRRHDIADLEIPLISIDEQVAFVELQNALSQRKEKYEKLIRLDEELLESQLKNLVWGE